MRIRRENIPFLKSLIMFGVGVPLAALGALTGVGVQVAAQPMVRFLLGLTPERSMGTAIAFGLVSSATGMIGASMGGLRSDLQISLVLAASATVGALLTVRMAVDPRLAKVRRFAQSAAMLLGLYLISGTVRSPYGPTSLQMDFFHSTAGYVAIGLIAGLLSSIFLLASGVLLVGGLVLLAGMAAPKAIVVSLIVITIASLLPAVTHAATGRVDTGAGSAMMLGGALGGIGGGLLLAKLAAIGSPIPIVVFALSAMFLSAWTAWRMQT
jgi:uncharacterized membrane protein YfcA